MAVSTSLTISNPTTKHKQTITSTPKRKKRTQKQFSSWPWEQIKNLLSCKQIEGSQIHDPANSNKKKEVSGYQKVGSSCNSICSFSDIVHGNTRVVHRADNSSPESSSQGQQTGRLLSFNQSAPVVRPNGACRNTTGYTSTASKSMPFRRLSGCYECHSIVDPSRLVSPRTTICRCPRCGEVFPKIESLELHQAVRHAVSELGVEDSGRNIVEIIFKSSWLKKDNPICKIERILKVHNTQRTVQRFESCRDAVKARAHTNTRCAADGNELLRFYCTTSACALGARGSSTLCRSIPGCGVCTIIRHGFAGKARDCNGVCTTASSGKAHDGLSCIDGRTRAMLVCRVIAGRVRPIALPPSLPDEGITPLGTYDSVAGRAGTYTDLEELLIANPMAILPCFVVIYKALD